MRIPNREPAVEIWIAAKTMLEENGTPGRKIGRTNMGTVCKALLC